MTAPAHSVELQIEVAQLSDPGRDPNKQINEDSCGYAVTRLGHLCVLCDGMGGHYGGQEASRRAVATIFEQIDKAPPGMSPAQALKAAVELAGRRVYELGGPPENKARPGSTVVAMLLHDAGVDVAHVGDSRAYMVRSGQIYPVTRDHSMVQAMIDSGFITEEQAIGHPDSNKITRALGMKPDVDVDLRPEPMELFPGDLLLSTSDGLTDLALSKDILGALRQALASGGLDHACQQLVRMANDRGGHDNITVQIVRVVGTARKKTQVGGTAPGTSGTSAQVGQPAWAGGASTPMLAGGAAVMSQSAQQGAHAHGPPQASPGPTHAPQGSAQPTSVDTIVDPRAGQHTYPMHPSPTAHDGTAHDGTNAHGPHGAGFARGMPQPAAPFAPVGAAAPMNPGVAQHGHSPHPPGVQPTVVHGVPMGGSSQHASGLSGYSLSGPAGLALPPTGMQHGAMQPVAMQPGQHHGGVFPTPAMSPTPPPVGGVAADPWAGFRHAPPAADEQLAPAELQRGSSVLYLVLGASFGVAVALMLLVWHFLLRR